MNAFMQVYAPNLKNIVAIQPALFVKLRSRQADGLLRNIAEE